MTILLTNIKPLDKEIQVLMITTEKNLSRHIKQAEKIGLKMAVIQTGDRDKCQN